MTDAFPRPRPSYRRGGSINTCLRCLPLDIPTIRGRGSMDNATRFYRTNRRARCRVQGYDRRMRGARFGCRRRKRDGRRRRKASLFFVFPLFFCLATAAAPARRAPRHNHQFRYVTNRAPIAPWRAHRSNSQLDRDRNDLSFEQIFARQLQRNRPQGSSRHRHRTSGKAATAHPRARGRREWAGAPTALGGNDGGASGDGRPADHRPLAHHRAHPGNDILLGRCCEGAGEWELRGCMRKVVSCAAN